MPLIDNARRVWCDRVIYKYIYVIFGSQQSADITLESKVWAVFELYFFDYAWLGLMD